MISPAPAKAHFAPSHVEACAANRPNQSPPSADLSSGAAIGLSFAASATPFSASAFNRLVVFSVPFSVMRVIIPESPSTHRPKQAMSTPMTAARIADLQTARLLLLRLQLADAEQVQQLFPHWEIVQYLNARVPWPFPPGGVLAYYREDALPAMERGDEWHWSLRLKTAPQQIIGAIGLFKGENNRGFWIGSEWQGQGLMTEAVIAINDYWFDVLKFPVLRAPKAIANTTSRRISQKTGMRLIATGTSDYVSGHLPSETWEITAEEWRAWHRNRSPR